MPVASLWPLPAPYPPAPAGRADLPLSAGDYAQAFLARLPSGRAWPRDADTNLARLASGIGLFVADNGARQFGLLRDAFPATTEALLPEWEASLGLPDPCIGVPATLSERQALVLQRWTLRGFADGSQSTAAMVMAAAALGIIVTVAEFENARSGRFRCGQPLYGRHPAVPWGRFHSGSRCGTPLADWSKLLRPATDWNHALRVTATSAVERRFHSGSRCGEPLADWSNPAIARVRNFTSGSKCGSRLRDWGNRALECTLRRLAPANAHVFFAYAGEPLYPPLN